MAKNPIIVRDANFVCNGFVYLDRLASGRVERKQSVSW